MKEMLKSLDFSSRGQVLLIVVVTMIVALTAGLAVTSRTITNLRISKQNEESQRAFQAASAGIDRFLNSSAGFSGTGDFQNASFQTRVLQQNSNNAILNNASDVPQDKGINLWLSNYPDYTERYNGTFTIYFGTESQNCSTTTGANVMPAIEIVVLTNTVTTPAFSKYVYDPCAGRRVGATGNNFAASNTVNTSIDGVTFTQASPPISVTNGLIAQVIPLYNSAKLGINWGAGAKTQGKILESTGTSGETTRKVIYYESHPQIPAEVFPYVILSQ